MVALFCSILGFVAFGALLKLAGQKGYAPTPVAAVNYLLAGALCGLASRSDAAAYRLAPVLIIGALAGISFVVGFYIYFGAIRRAGLSVAQPTVGMAVVIPTLASIALWREQPTPLQVLAIAAVAVALVLVGTGAGSNGGGHDGHHASTMALLVALFCIQGLTLVAPKVLEETGNGAHRWAYLTVLFGAAAVGACGRWLRDGDRVTTPGLLVGVGLGLTNVVATALMSVALAALPGIVVFPVSSIGPMLLGMALGIIVWGERPSRRALIGTAIAIPAVLLLSL
ncbi:MAG: EamA family transporter [Anaerolineae bacterium]